MHDAGADPQLTGAIQVRTAHDCVECWEAIENPASDKVSTQILSLSRSPGVVTQIGTEIKKAVDQAISGKFARVTPTSKLGLKMSQITLAKSPGGLCCVSQSSQAGGRPASCAVLCSNF